VLLNLLNNAARFTERGSVTVRAFCEEANVVVEVEDSGVGVKEKDLGKLFQPFYQLESSPTRGRGGTGLGLAISKHFVELHGGRIWARSEGVEGKGSTFGFALPIEPDAEAIEPSRPGQVDRHWELPSAPPAPTVVVLDDDPAVVRLLRRHLDEYQVVGAATEGEALALARNLRAHALITDLADGDQSWHQAWLKTSTLEGLRVLGCPMPSGRRIARTRGLADYLVKPVTQEALLRSVQAAAPQARTVLVVDDDPQMVRLLCRMLRSSPAGYRLRRAYDGEQGLEVMRRTLPDLVLLDLLMPKLDGVTVLENMKSDPALSSIPVVAVSARGAVEAISPSSTRVLSLVTDDVLPVSQLLGALKTVLDALPPREAKGQPTDREPLEASPESGAFG
jgi:CheY-like chemotaxis protein